MVSRSSQPRTNARWLHIEAPSAATVPRRQTFRRSAISVGLLCLSTAAIWSPRTRRYAGLISCSVPGLSQWVMGGCAVPRCRDCSYLSRQIYRWPPSPPSPLYSMRAPDADLSSRARKIDEYALYTYETCNFARVYHIRTRSLSF